MSAPPPPWHCTLCSVTVPVDELEEHFTTQSHQEFLQYNSHPSQNWLCELCNVDIEGNLADIENHLRSTEHKEQCKVYPMFYPPLPVAPAPNSTANNNNESLPPPPATSPPPLPTPSHVNLAWGNWWCDLCGTAMNVNAKEAHLRGKQHAKKLRAITSTSESVDQSTIPPTSGSIPPLGGDIWRCELCQRSMQADQKEIHINGADHIKRMRILSGQPMTDQWTCVVCERSMQLDQREPHLRGSDHLKKEKAKGTWYCVLCQRVMQAGQKEEHLRGADHVGLIPAGQPDPASPSSLPPIPANGDLWHCEVCGRTMQINQRELHEGGIEHIKRLAPRPTGQWTCVPCGRTMAIDSKALHEGGIAHIKALARHQAGGTVMWTCEVCSRTMQVEQKSLHLGGQEHLKAVRRRDLLAAAQAEAAAADAGATANAAPTFPAPPYQA